MSLQYWFMAPVAAVIATVGHFVRFAQAGREILGTVLSIVIFTVPGVIIGAQIGSVVSSRIPQRLLELSLAVLFTVVALLTVGEVVL